MSFRMFTLAMVVASMFVSANVFAAEDAEPTTHDGKFVSLTDGKLVMTTKEGKMHSHSMASDATMTLDGQECKVEDMKAGLKIRVTTKAGDEKIAVNVEAISKNEMFANTHDGKFISLKGDKLVMTMTKGKEEHTHTLISAAKFTCDGKVCKATDLKPGMKIRVSTQAKDPHSATRIEAIDKNEAFASL
jgi:hypothetical protein